MHTLNLDTRKKKESPPYLSTGMPDVCSPPAPRRAEFLK